MQSVDFLRDFIKLADRVRNQLISFQKEQEKVFLERLNKADALKGKVAKKLLQNGQKRKDFG